MDKYRLQRAYTKATALMEAGDPRFSLLFNDMIAYSTTGSLILLREDGTLQVWKSSGKDTVDRLLRELTSSETILTIDGADSTLEVIDNDGMMELRIGDSVKLLNFEEWLKLKDTIFNFLPFAIEQSVTSGIKGNLRVKGHEKAQVSDVLYKWGQKMSISEYRSILQSAHENWRAFMEWMDHTYLKN